MHKTSCRVPGLPLLLLAIALLTTLIFYQAVADQNPNSFNRLMRPASERNAPPPEDGIHDPSAYGSIAKVNIW